MLPQGLRSQNKNKQFLTLALALPRHAVFALLLIFCKYIKFIDAVVPQPFHSSSYQK